TFVRPTIDECFEAVAALGVRCIQFNFACAGIPSLPESLSSELLERIGRAARTRQIEIAAVSGTYNMIHPDPRERAECLRRLAVVARGCRHLGAPMLTLCTGTRDPNDMWRRHPENDSSA